MKNSSIRIKSLLFFLPLTILLILFFSMGVVSAQVNQIVGGNINISQLTANQTEVAIAIDPTNTNNLFAFSNDEGSRPGLFAAFSTDGGATWTDSDTSDSTIADGGDGLPTACCDPSASWDNFGNLFISYLGANGQVHVIVSVDGGQNFTFLTSLGTDTDFPHIDAAAGPAAGSVWVTYQEGGVGIMASGATVSGLGVVGAFSAPQFAPGSGAGNFGGISIAPGGQVLITYQSPSGGQGPNTIFVNLDADGLGAGGFGAAIAATTTNVGGFDFIPAQPDRSIPANAFLAYDRSGGANNGRVYLVYADETPDESNDTDIFVRFSNDNGTTWSAPVRVNDDATTNSQFMAHIAVDQTNGFVAVSWHDCRNDTGSGPSDTDGIANTDAEFFATVSIDGGLTFEPNVQISAGSSNENGAEPPGGGFVDIDFGDYTGLAFSGGTYYPAWADNSNSTSDNPDGTLTRFDIYIAAVQVNLFEVDKDYRFTDVCFEKDNDMDGEFTEDPVNFIPGTTIPIDDDGDGLFNEDDTECPTGTDLGTLLPIAVRAGVERFVVEAVLKRNGTVSSYNPGQYYAVSTIEVVSDISELTISEDYSDCVDNDLSALNPPRGGGSVVIVMVGPDGVAKQIMDAKSPNVDIVNGTAHAHIMNPIPAGTTVLMYVKFGPGLKNDFVPLFPGNTCVNENSAVAGDPDNPVDSGSATADLMVRPK